jgi:hypothetical protein
MTESSPVTGPRHKTRETTWFTMKPDMYGGPKCDQMEPRWWGYADGDKEGDFQHEPLSLDARFYPPGTKITIEEPICPKCEESREPNYEDGKYLPGFVPKCRCGFDWDIWVGNEFS